MVLSGWEGWKVPVRGSQVQKAKPEVLVGQPSVLFCTKDPEPSGQTESHLIPLLSYLLSQHRSEAAEVLEELDVLVVLEVLDLVVVVVVDVEEVVVVVVEVEVGVGAGKIQLSTSTAPLGPEMQSGQVWWERQCLRR